jgi:hypothetical protein
MSYLVSTFSSLQQCSHGPREHAYLRHDVLRKKVLVKVLVRGQAGRAGRPLSASMTFDMQLGREHRRRRCSVMQMCSNHPSEGHLIILEHSSTWIPFLPEIPSSIRPLPVRTSHISSFYLSHHGHLAGPSGGKGDSIQQPALPLYHDVWEIKLVRSSTQLF